MNRAHNVLKWIASMLTLPIGYVWLPVSCCFINPMIKIAHPQLIEELNNAPHPQNKMIINLVGMMSGAVSLVSCGCCCCGCFGQKSPDDEYT